MPCAPKIIRTFAGVLGINSQTRTRISSLRIFSNDSIFWCVRSITQCGCTCACAVACLRPHNSISNVVVSVTIHDIIYTGTGCFVYLMGGFLSSYKAGFSKFRFFQRFFFFVRQIPVRILQMLLLGVSSNCRFFQPLRNTGKFSKLAKDQENETRERQVKGFFKGEKLGPFFFPENHICSKHFNNRWRLLSSEFFVFRLCQ